MELPKQPSDEKKSKPSFWNRLLRLPRKSHVKEKQEDSFRRQSMLYSSLNTTRKDAQSSSTSDESENFTTLESSALMDVHRDAGILFLNKSSVANCFAPREENKHVQFAPTPMNKYYQVDIKSAPSNKQYEENKENLRQTKSSKPSRPILRLDKNRKISLHSSSGEDTHSNPETRLVNVTYIDGPEFKTPSLPRTSTKLALVNRENGSLQQLNVSNIVKYSSLPRNKRIPDETPPFRENVQFTSRANDTRSTESMCTQSNKYIRQVADTEQRYRRSMRGLNIHRQSCYGVSDPSRLFEGRKVLYQDCNQDARQRLSLGRPLNPSRMSNDSSLQSQSITQKSHSTQESQKYFKKFFNVSMSSKNQSYARSLDQPIRHPASNRGYLTENNTDRLNRKHYHASTGHIPNKAINEVGLPIVANKARPTNSSKSRSISPQYIELSETFTKTKANVKKNGNAIPSNSNYKDQRLSTVEFSEVISQKQKASSSIQNKRPDVGSAEQDNEQLAIISENRRRAIRSVMYTQKRKIVNKICKYNSKQSDEGFSSMADDECSFNCSCPSCITKLSKSYKRCGLKQLFSHNKDKYFFMIEPEIKEGNEMERLPENQTFEGPMAVAQPQLSSKSENEPAQDKTWYDCNDTLCQTPGKNNSSEKNIEGPCETFRTPTNKMVDNLYENITEIINSATKRNLKPQDIKRILSTPISSPLNLVGTKCQIKPQRALFPDDTDKCATLDHSLQKILTPIKSDNFNDSIVLLQEIFQKLSQECKELLQPNVSSSILSQTNSSPLNQDSPGNKYVNDLVKNLKSVELSEADFANIIGGIAQNIFSETKAKNREVRTLVHSSSLPDLQKKASLLNKAISVANSLRDLCDLQISSKTESTSKQNSSRYTNYARAESALYEESEAGIRELPDGWSRTPTTENSNFSNDVSSTKLSSSGTDKCSEGELQLLENAIRLGMGLSPVDKVKKTSMYAASPTKASKYKSRDVLSGKGKLKLKIYNNSGLVTVYVMKAAKLDWTNGRELNAYVKITMIPDESKRVHWRTNVQKSQRNPVFNQKFSFELLAEDVTKRLIFSVWHRDFVKQRSELIGCMSFSVRHVMDNAHNVDGWYRLLRERFGTQKHFAAHARKNSCSFKK